ncbi:MAG: Hint domain-containing protein [Pseudomonadota bacterium]
MTKFINFNDLATGTVVDNEFSSQGVSISAVGGSNKAMIFDTAHPTGGDHDLETTNLNKALIISEDGNSHDPDDNSGGGKLIFDFDDAAYVNRLTFLDLEEGARIKFYDPDGHFIKTIHIDSTDDNGQIIQDLDVGNVGRMEVELHGSAAIDNLVFDDFGDGVVEGTDGNDHIDINYLDDPEGDRIDNGDALLPGEAPNDDIVDAGAGHDDIESGVGDDDVYAGSGDDKVDGGDGDDLIFGDSNYTGQNAGITVRESFEWDEEGLHDGDTLTGFTQDTGNVDVTFSILSQSGASETEFTTDEQNVSNIDADGNPVDDESSLDNVLNGKGNQSNYRFDFSKEVEDVSFRINDIDGDGVVQVRAYNEAGHAIVVNLEAGSELTLSDTDGVPGQDTADSNGGYLDDDSDEYSLLVSIPGPVARIEITHTQDGKDNTGINVTDIYFDAPVVDDGADGDDDLKGGLGDDTIFGEGGEDYIKGEDGNDSLDGGADDDKIYGGAGEDTVQGGSGDDEIKGGDDDDKLLGGDGVDKIYGNDGDDLIKGGAGDDYKLSGDRGDDTIFGDDGDDRIDGDYGNDELYGGDGDDKIKGGKDDDLISGGEGADTLEGEYDRDMFINITAGDYVDGGSSGDDFDTLDLTGAGPNRVTFSSSDNEDGFVEFLDGDGNVTGKMVFEEIENIVGGNIAPKAKDDTVSGDEDTLITGNVLTNDSDPNGDTLEVIDNTDPSNGSVVVNADGSFEYTPDENFNGTDSFTYTVSDGKGGTDTATVTITVDAVNDDPVAVDDDDGIGTEFETPVDIPVLDNDFDVDGDTLTVVSAGDGSNGTTMVNPDGTITYDPNDDFSGTDTFTYTITDGNGGTDTATVTVTVGEDPRDGIVEGTDGADTIDAAYEGDPEGDLIDAGDAILPGEGPDDDIVLAGGGDDIVESGAGDDDVDAGGGNDTVITGDGSDKVFGDQGDDVIDTSGGDNLIDFETFIGVPFETGLAQFDDRDTVIGGGGNDSITTGDDADFITGDLGNDTIDGGIDDDTISGGLGDDSIIGGLGNDSIDGGQGDDTIIAGVDAFSDYVGDDPNLTGSNPIFRDSPGGELSDSDPNPDDGRDIVNGGEGNDIIITGDDDDTITGGQGNDSINAGIDDDSVQGNAGDDLIIGSHGSDTISGGSGDDTIFGGFGPDPIPGFPNEFPDEAGDPVPDNGRDSIDGGDGDDVIFGEDDDDTLLGGTGDDTVDGGVDDDSIRGQDGDDSLIGGQGDDTVQGGAGDDTISGGAGADQLEGRADRDTFTDITAGDDVDGGESTTSGDPADDFDTLDLTGAAEAENPGGGLTVTFTSADQEDGFVEFKDSDGNVTGTMEFRNIENVIPCFTPGTVIATPQGERLVEELREGDKIITRDNGLQEIRWVGRRDLSGQELVNAPHLTPVLIRAGSLGHGLPERDMMVSPQHRLLINNEKTALYFEDREVLAAAKHLTGMEGVDNVAASTVSYIHFMFDQHEVVLSNGSWTESFQPGETVLDGMGNAQRNEIFELFPELSEKEGLDAYQAARRSLKKHEARLLVK